ncbi:hypothetical protein A2954_00645 [Candidatus Roizmanbacteria bacterium RIFCSPLOWO2_01_FULL_37_12]|uniref:Uncharacterized protein n=1 Tax=Candidatus Roizmanbacteria bacterium RIFCSPLOWO2_01_FULL_37_12 TaxID=1802056 RepID=A0A1F7IDS0_9BACT|nr:MAG: hypothetical protein A2954_00645 [Candidatus Roizmanbacteria bacterium RIFCSPLOWO2_01_FULL_37_12]
MSDYLIIRIPFDNPSKPEIIEFLANVPLDWKKYLIQVANRVQKKGRYVVANLEYDFDHFYPAKKEATFKKVEKLTEGKA